MKNLCKVLLNDKVSYFDFLSHIQFVEEKYIIEEGEVEKGLFTFFNYFFKNDNNKLVLKYDKEIKHKDEKYKDFLIAKELAS